MAAEALARALSRGRNQWEEEQDNSGETWSTCLQNETEFWSPRKCSVYMHLFAAVVCLLSDTKKCGIPLGFWLAVQFCFLTAETLIKEMRERMNNSSYWVARRRRKKWVQGLTVGLKEVGEYTWLIYGATLYFSDRSDGCSDENAGFMIVMVMFLVMAALKVILLLVVAVILIVFACSQRMKRRNERNASKDILRSLARIKYSAL